MNLRQTAMAIRFWADTVHSGFKHALDPSNESEHAVERRAAVMPTALGAGIVIGVSLLERLAMDKIAELQNREPQSIQSMTQLQWVDELSLELQPGTRAELANFIRLRHYFAHEYGRATSQQIGHLADYLDRLESGDIEDEDGGEIRPYFSIDESNEIQLRPESRNRLRKTLWYVAREIENAT